MQNTDVQTIDYTALHYGDVISFQVNGGWVASGSFYHDTIPDSEVPESHLRVSSLPTPNDSQDLGNLMPNAFEPNFLLNGTKESSLPEDFHTRCAFLILPDIRCGPGSSSIAGVFASGPIPLTYGSIVRLVHVATGQHILATEVYIQSTADTCAAHLRQLDTKSASSNASLFYIQPRHAMRTEGEAVCNSDRVVFESVQYKERQLCAGEPIRISTVKVPKIKNNSIIDETGPIQGALEDHIYTGKDAFEKEGWKIVRLAKIESEAVDSFGKTTAATKVLRGGDFVRLWHRQAGGYLIAREDDAPERHSKVVPFGLVCKKLARNRNHTILPLIRLTSSRRQHCAASIWQVVNERPLDGTEVEWLSAIRLRHLLTGQYLCVRVPVAMDPSSMSIPQVQHSSTLSVGISKMIVATTRDYRDPRTLFDLIPTATDAEGNTSGRDPVRYGSSLLLQHRQTKFHFFIADAAQTAMAHAPGNANLAFLSPSMILRDERIKNTRSLMRNQSISSSTKGLSKKTRHMWWEYEGDRGLYPAFDDPSSEVYRISQVSDDQLRDVLHVMKHIPILKSAVTEVWQHHGPRADPRFDSLVRTMNSLKSWVLGEVPRDGVMLWGDMHATNNIDQLTRHSIAFDPFDSKRFSVHSQHKKPNLSLSTNQQMWNTRKNEKWIPPTSQQAIYSRQMIASSLRIPEFLMHFTTSWAMIGRGLKSSSVDNAIEMRHEVRHSAAEAYKLLKALVLKNKHVAKTLRELHGVSHMITHLPLRWDPPIEDVVLASSTDGNSFDRFESMTSQFRLTLNSRMTNHVKSEIPSKNRMNDSESTKSILSKAEVFHLVLLVYRACCTRDHHFWPMLDLLCTIAAPGGTPDHSMQSFLCSMLAGELKYLDPETLCQPSDLNETNKNYSSMLMETRKGPSGNWQVNLRHTKINAPSYLPPAEEVDNYLEDERALLRQLFLRYDVDESGAIDSDELRSLLHDLGMPAPLMDAAAASLNHNEELTWDRFRKWWESNRAVFSVTGAIIMDSGTAAKGKLYRAMNFYNGNSDVSPIHHRIRPSKVLRNIFPSSTSRDNHSDTDPSPDKADIECKNMFQFSDSIFDQKSNCGLSQSAPISSGRTNASKIFRKADPVTEYKFGTQDVKSIVTLLEKQESSDSLHVSRRDIMDELPVRRLSRTQKYLHSVQDLVEDENKGITANVIVEEPDEKKSRWSSALPVKSDVLTNFKWGHSIFHRSDSQCPDESDKEEELESISNLGDTDALRSCHDGWEDVAAALKGRGEAGHAGANWLRATLNLFTAICEGSHITCQKVIMAIVPPNMLLDLLESKAILKGDKATILKLLSVLYVEHDIVFTSQPLDFQSVSCVPLIPERFKQLATTQIFSLASQNCSLESQGDIDLPKQHRQRLLKLLYRDLLEMKFDVYSFHNPSQYGHARYQLQLLRLTKKLVEKGFFFRGGSEAASGVFSNRPSYDQNQTNHVSIVDEEESWSGMHLPESHNNIGKSKRFIESFGENGWKAWSGASSQRNVMTDDFVVYHYDLETILMKKWSDSLKEHARDKKKVFSGRHDEEQEFVDLFSNEILIDIKKEVISILKHLMSVRHLQNFYALLHFVIGPNGLHSLYIMDPIFSSTASRGSNSFDFLYSGDGTDEKITKALINFSSELQLDGTQFNLAADFTLHSKQDLLHVAYRHLLQLTFNEESFLHLVENVDVMIDPAVARVDRCAKGFSRLIDKYGSMAFPSTSLSKSDNAVVQEILFYQSLIELALAELEKLASYALQNIPKPINYRSGFQRSMFCSRSTMPDSLSGDEDENWVHDDTSSNRVALQHFIARTESDERVRNNEIRKSFTYGSQASTPRGNDSSKVTGVQRGISAGSEITDVSRPALGHNDDIIIWNYKNAGTSANYLNSVPGSACNENNRMKQDKGIRFLSTKTKKLSLGGMYSAVTKVNQTKKYVHLHLIPQSQEFNDCTAEHEHRRGILISRFIDPLLDSCHSVIRCLLGYISKESEIRMMPLQPAKLPMMPCAVTANRCFEYLLMIFSQRPQSAYEKLGIHINRNFIRVSFFLPAAAEVLALIIREAGYLEKFSEEELQELIRRSFGSQLDSIPRVWRHSSLILLHSIIFSEMNNIDRPAANSLSTQYSPSYNVDSPSSLFDEHNNVADLKPARAQSIVAEKDDDKISPTNKEICRSLISQILNDAECCSDLMSTEKMSSRDDEEWRIDVLRLASQFLSDSFPSLLRKPIENSFSVESISNLYAVTPVAPLKVSLLKFLKSKVERRGKRLITAIQNEIEQNAKLNGPSPLRSGRAGTVGGLGATLAGAKWLNRIKNRRDTDSKYGSFNIDATHISRNADTHISPMNTNCQNPPTLEHRNSCRHETALTNGVSIRGTDLQRSRSCSPDQDIDLRKFEYRFSSTPVDPMIIPPIIAEEDLASILDKKILKVVDYVAHDIRKIQNISWLQDSEYRQDTAQVDEFHDQISTFITLTKVERFLPFLSDGVIPFLMSVLRVYCPSCTPDAIARYTCQLEFSALRRSESVQLNVTGPSGDRSIPLTNKNNERSGHIGVSSVISSIGNVKFGWRKSKQNNTGSQEQESQFAAVSELCKAILRCDSLRLAIIERNVDILDTFKDLIVATGMCQNTEMDGNFSNDWTPLAKFPSLFMEALLSIHHLRQGAEVSKHSSQKLMAKRIKDSIVGRLKNEIAKKRAKANHSWSMDPSHATKYIPRFQTGFSCLFKSDKEYQYKALLPTGFAFDSVSISDSDIDIHRYANIFIENQSNGEMRLVNTAAVSTIDIEWLIPENILKKMYFSKYLRQQFQSYLDSNSIRARLLAVVRGGESQGYEEFKQRGGLYLARAMGSIPTMVDDGDLLTAIFLLESLQTLVVDRVNARRKDQSLNSKLKLTLVEQEARQLRRVQDGLVSLGAHILVMKVLGRVATFLQKDQKSLLTRLLPRILYFGTSLLAHGNSNTQDMFIDCFYSCVDNPNEMAMRYFPAGLLYVISHLRLHMEHLGTTTSYNSQDENEGNDILSTSQLFPLYKAVLKFIAMLCAGNNTSAKDFLREQVSISTEGCQANIVREISILVQATCKVVYTRIKYVTGREWESVVAPLLPGSETHRRFIAWHRAEEMDLPLMQKLFILLEEGFHTLTELVQGPNTQNQILCLKSIQFAGPILEFCGALYIKLSSISPSKVMRVWHGGQPIKFIREYLAEASVNKELQQDEGGLELEAMNRAMSKFQSNSNSVLSFKSIFNKSSKVKSKIDRFCGITLADFKGAAFACEEALLQLLLAILEGQTSQAVAHLESHTNMGILLQNMNCALNSKHNREGNGIDLSNSVVLYLTLATSLAEASLDSMYQLNARRLLEAYRFQAGQVATSSIASQGTRILSDELIASIEIMGPNKEDDPHQVFFPVPNFVKKYWNYPEVRKTRQRLIYEVSRDSPEEKILDFYVKMEQLIATMKRQERIGQVLGPLHCLVGGKSFTFIPRWLPSQRMVLFLTTLLLNFLLIYSSYFDDGEADLDVIYYYRFEDWNNYSTIMGILRWFHVGMCGSLLFARLVNYVPHYQRLFRKFGVLNKRNHDIHDGSDERGNHVMALSYSTTKAINIGSKYVFSRFSYGKDTFIRIMHILLLCCEHIWDAIWEFIMIGISLAGTLHNHVWYSIAILDIIPQSRVMVFVLRAVQRNIQKIFITVILLMMALYLYSIITWLSWKDQYELYNHGGCTSILSCWLLHLNYGMLEAPSWKNLDSFVRPDIDGLNYGRREDAWLDIAVTTGATFWQLSYYIVVNLVIGAIMAGVIIDTFSEMRQESEMKEADIREKCFICSLDRDSFEQVGVLFSNHITEEHNLWKYVWFKLYLEQKDPLTYTGPEHHAARLFKRKNDFVRLIPIKKALSIRRAAGTVRETHDLASIFAKVKQLSEATGKLSEALSNKFLEQEEDSRRIRVLTKQGERLEKMVKRMEQRFDVGRRESSIQPLHQHSSLLSPDGSP